MLTGHSGAIPPQHLDPHQRELGDIAWLDLLNATEAERATAERLTGLRVPSEAEIVEIESSSRLRQEAGALYLSAPLIARGPDGERVRSSIGFVLSPSVLMTVHSADAPALAAYADRLATGERLASVAIFLGLLEALVDRLADVLEMTGTRLDALSRRIFHDTATSRRNRRREDAMLRSVLHEIGHTGDLVSNLRDSLLTLARIVPYVNDSAHAWLDDGASKRLATLRQDVASLSDYDNQISNKVQFLLDATLGFLNIEQNNGIKILTVVSIVGIPPTLIASIYGMNFKNIPELGWAYGYEYGLTVIVLSVVLPLLLFKWKGWL